MATKLKVDLGIGLKGLEIFTKGMVNTNFLGNYKSVFKGKGLEFADYRPYMPDDDASLIDWKASVRANQFLIREFIEERNLNVFFLIDVSNSMILSSIPKLKCEYAAELVSCLSYAMLTAGDNIGYALFNDSIVKEMPPTGGLKQFYTFLDILTDPKMYSGNYDIKKAIKFLIERIKERTLVFIISDFIGAQQGWEKDLEIAANKFDLIGIMVRDPIDKAITGGMGQLAIIDPFSENRLFIEPNSIKEAYAKETRRDEKEVEDIFKNNNSDFLSLTTNKPFLEPLITLFKSRAKKWR